MIRRLNYTQRKSIDKQHAQITLEADDDQIAEFTAVIDLAPYHLPKDAPVFLEATRQTSFMRWNLGTVGQIAYPSDRRLTEFPSGEAVTFRIKVVEPAGRDGLPPRILANVSGIRPRRPQKPRQRRSLLPVDWGTDEAFRHQPWRLEIDDQGGPVLYVSSFLVDKHQRDAFVATREFVSLALPLIFQMILTQILIIDKSASDPAAGNWREDWLSLAKRLAGEVADEDAYQREEWIESAVAAFCRKHEIGNRFMKWRRGKE